MTSENKREPNWVTNGLFMSNVVSRIGVKNVLSNGQNKPLEEFG